MVSRIPKPNFDTRQFRINYAASLSSGVKLLMRISPDHIKENFCSILEGVVEDFEENPRFQKASESLREPNIYGNKAQILRQCDVRSEPDGQGKLHFKTFMSWNHGLNCWHLYVELPDETWVEEGVFDPSNN